MRKNAKDKAVAVLGFHDGNAGQIATWFEEVMGLEIACYVLESDEPFTLDIEAENRRRVNKRTDFPRHGKFKGRPFIVSRDWLAELKKMGIGRVLPLTPENRVRLRQVNACRAQGFELVSAIHPTATILAEALIAPGAWLHARCIIGYKVEIGTGVIVNTGAQIDHHGVLEQGAQVDPGVVTASNVTLRECSHVHTGATIINRITIGADAIIGAGAVVIKDIPARCTAVGVPARVIKESVVTGS
jgi:sugar O-acyltransferase (sialic acid O-acetyltransferase NeuD family)